jgi:hypothetical protein
MEFPSSVNGLDMNLLEKAMVIGATSGIGKELAKLLADNKLIPGKIFDKMYL